jgi:hypothetical protein
VSVGIADVHGERFAGLVDLAVPAHRAAGPELDMRVFAEVAHDAVERDVVDVEGVVPRLGAVPVVEVERELVVHSHGHERSCWTGHFETE